MNQTIDSVRGNAPERRTYTVEEIAKILNIGRTSAYSLVKEGHFKVVRVGNAIRISKKSFDEWLDAKSEKHGKNGRPGILTKKRCVGKRRSKISRMREPFFLRATKLWLISYTILCPLMGSKSGVFLCMIVRLV